MEIEECSRKQLDGCPKLLDLIPKDREWLLKTDKTRSQTPQEENKLELRLGLPGQDWATSKENPRNNRERDEALLSLGCFSSMAPLTQSQKFTSTENPIGALLSSPWPSSGYQRTTQHNQHETRAQSFHHLPSTSQILPVMPKDLSQAKAADVQSAEKEAFSPSAVNTAVSNGSQKRSAPAPVVGWPPIRSFRKNLACTSSSKQASASQNADPIKVPKDKPVETCKNGLFVKINMDGVPIGRKVDLSAYDSYEKLSSVVDELFRGLLAAQRDNFAGGIQGKQEEEKPITGLLDGSGEYTFVYEDNEGDRMLVGDVPWNMFVSTVKRLRVLKSSEVSAFSLGSNKAGKIATSSD